MKANLSTSSTGRGSITRWPIGKVETIKAANTDRLRRFYKANYRPENATIIIVGNIDPAAVEQKIRAKFSDWKAGGTPDPIDLGTPTGKKLVGEYVAAGAPDQLGLNWVSPDDRRAETEAVDREKLIKQLALTVLNQRLADRASKPGSPYVGAQAMNIPSLLHSGGLTQLGLAASPDKWQQALDAVSSEQRMLLRDGVQPGELQRAITSLRTQFQRRPRSHRPASRPDIADEIVTQVNNDNLYTSDAQDLAFVTPLLAKVTAADVNASLKSLFGHSKPILFRSAQQGPAGETCSPAP